MRGGCCRSRSPILPVADLGPYRFAAGDAARLAGQVQRRRRRRGPGDDGSSRRPAGARRSTRPAAEPVVIRWKVRRAAPAGRHPARRRLLHGGGDRRAVSAARCGSATGARGRCPTRRTPACGREGELVAVGPRCTADAASGSGRSRSPTPRADWSPGARSGSRPRPGLTPPPGDQRDVRARRVRRASRGAAGRRPKQPDRLPVRCSLRRCRRLDDRRRSSPPYGTPRWRGRVRRRPARGSSSPPPSAS